MGDYWRPHYYPPQKEPEPIPEPVKNPGDGDENARSLLERHFGVLKSECSDLERLIAVVTEDCQIYGLTDKDLKRLDKAVTVMKVGMKIVKKVARREGMRKRRKALKEQKT